MPAPKVKNPGPGRAILSTNGQPPRRVVMPACDTPGVYAPTEGDRELSMLSDALEQAHALLKDLGLAVAPVSCSRMPDPDVQKATDAGVDYPQSPNGIRIRASTCRVIDLCRELDALTGHLRC